VRVCGAETVVNRRAFLNAALLAPAALRRAAAEATPMKVTRIETVCWPPPGANGWRPHDGIWVRIQTDNGLSGIGETYPRGEAEAAMLHSAFARMLLGKDPRDIDRIWADLYWDSDVRVAGGAEMRVISALDLALWDLLGKALNTPVYRLIGGKSNPRVRLYNTAFSQRYDFNKDPEKIMRELIETNGIKAIKIWPFDGAARRNRRQFITVADIEQALSPVRKLRDTFGNDIEILMEFHGNWNLTAAVRIAKALEPYKPMWLEDMLMPGNYQQYRQLAEATSLPLTISERIGGKMQFLQVLESHAAKFIMFDLAWCGGLSEARKIATMADAFELPFAPHAAGGLLPFYAALHLSTASTNFWIQEIAQTQFEVTWPKCLENPIVPKNGCVEVPELPGFGMAIKPEIWKYPGAVTQTSTA
jgi:galactonate dehydratase